MGWRRRWPERETRPAVQRLSDERKKRILTTLKAGIESSPVLSNLNIRARLLRGRFYIERLWPIPEEEAEIEVIGRITPPVTPINSLILEVEKSKGSWYQVARGSAKKLSNVIASDSKGTFHGLGALDKSLREMENCQSRLEVYMSEDYRFFYTKTGQECTTQEALYHYFGVPINIIAEPRAWYIYHRIPRIVEVSNDRTSVLVRFTAMSFSGSTFGGTCLYTMKDNKWCAFTIKPNQSKNIMTSLAWLEKRGWKVW